MFSSAALYPLEVIKTNLQAQTKPKKTSPVTSTRSRPFDVETGGESRPSTVNVYTGAEGTAEAEVVMSAAAAGQRSPDIGGISTENGSGREEGKIEAWKEDSAKEEPPSVMSVAREIYSREGILGFYNGTFYASGQSGLEKAAYFYGYGWLKALALRGGGGGGGVGGVERELSAVTDLGLGYLAEAFHLPFTIPIEVSPWRLTIGDGLDMIASTHFLPLACARLVYLRVRSFFLLPESFSNPIQADCHSLEVVNWENVPHLTPLGQSPPDLCPRNVCVVPYVRSCNQIIEESCFVRSLT